MTTPPPTPPGVPDPDQPYNLAPPPPQVSPRVRGPGRVHAITDDVVVATKDGPAVVPFTEAVCRYLRSGSYLETALAAVGCHRSMAMNWLKTGGQVARRVAADRAAADNLSAYEQNCWAFQYAVTEAEARWLAHQEAQLETLARGGHRTEQITEEFNAGGKLVKRTVRTTTLPPDPKAIQWRMERRVPALYGPRVLHTGPDGGGPVEVTVTPAGLADKLARLQAATGTEPEDDR